MAKSALMRDINAPTPGAAVAQARRPYAALYPELAAINQLEAIGHSEYNSLQMSLIQSASHVLSGRVNYTLSHALDNGSEARNTLPMIQNDIDADWGNAAFDIRHVLGAGFSYSLPAMGTSRFGDGWQLNMIATIQSGSPFKAWALGRGQAALAGVSRARAKRRVRGSRPGILRLG